MRFPRGSPVYLPCVASGSSLLQPLGTPKTCRSGLPFAAHPPATLSSLGTTGPPAAHREREFAPTGSPRWDPARAGGEGGGSLLQDTLARLLSFVRVGRIPIYCGNGLD